MLGSCGTATHGLKLEPIFCLHLSVFWLEADPVQADQGWWKQLPSVSLSASLWEKKVEGAPECCRGTGPAETRGGGQPSRPKLSASVGIPVEISASPTLCFWLISRFHQRRLPGDWLENWFCLINRKEAQGFWPCLLAVHFLQEGQKENVFRRQSSCLEEGWGESENNKKGGFKDPPLKCRLLNIEAELIAARRVCWGFLWKKK